MTRLAEFFIDLREKREHYLSGSTGKHFEDRLSAKLEKLGYSRIIRADIEEDGFVSLKQQVLEKIRQDDIKNPFTHFKKHYIEQPYGTQNYPDFIILDDENVINIEVKFSDGKQGKPVWNSGLPRPNGIYIFGANKRKDLTFFRGCDVVGITEARKLHAFFDEGLREAQKRFNTNEMKAQEYGFAAYIRKAFEQKKTYNPNAVVDFFTNAKRKELEQAVISHLRK